MSVPEHLGAAPLQWQASWEDYLGPSEDVRAEHVDGKVVVEVLSTNRRDDLVRKVQKYARARLPHHWIVDPVDGSPDAFRLGADGLDEATVHLDLGQSGDVDLGIASLQVDVARYLR